MADATVFMRRWMQQWTCVSYSAEMKQDRPLGLSCSLPGAREKVDCAAYFLPGRMTSLSEKMGP